MLNNRTLQLTGLVVAWIAGMALIWKLATAWSVISAVILPGNPVGDSMRMSEVMLGVMVIILFLGRMTWLYVRNDDD